MTIADPTPTLHAFLARLSSRSPLGADDRAAVLRLPVTPRQIDSHRRIIGTGERDGFVCLVAEGLVARYSQTDDGKRQLISFHLPGDIADIHSLLLPAAPAALVALSPTLIYQIPHQALLQAASDHPGLAMALWRDSMVDARIVAEWLVSVGKRNARARIAHLLCEMALRYDQIGHFREGAFPFSVTQEVMADALGVTPVHINRSLKSLREEGLIELTRFEATILDWDRLADAGDFDATYLQLPPEPERALAALG